jgi:RecA-family ATPase
MTDKIKQNNIGVVIIDPFVSAHLVNENNNGSIQAVVAMLRKLARDTDSSIQLVHHIRKTNGDDATIDSVRGAGSLIGAARAARVINRVSMDDAMALGVDEHESLGIFRVDDGKANLAPPADKCIYRRMHSVEIANGEHIGVAVTTKDALEVQRKVAEAEKNDNPYRMSVQAKNWIGLAVCKQLNLDVEKKNEKTKAKKIVEQWISTKVLKQVEVPDKRQGRDVQGVVVGEWISAE